MDQPHRMKYAKSPGLGLDSRPPPAAPPALGLALLLDRVSHQQGTSCALAARVHSLGK